MLYPQIICNDVFSAVSFLINLSSALPAMTPVPFDESFVWESWPQLHALLVAVYVALLFVQKSAYWSGLCCTAPPFPLPQPLPSRCLVHSSHCWSLGHGHPRCPAITTAQITAATMAPQKCQLWPPVCVSQKM